MKELQTLLDVRGATSIDPNAFPNTPVGSFWSSSLYGSSGDALWTVNFKDGHTFQFSTGYDLWIRCVR